MKLSKNEEFALFWLHFYNGGAILSTQLESSATIGVFGETEVPSSRVMNKLVKKDLVLLTEEDDEWTPMYQITEEGEKLAKTLANSN